MPVSKKLNYKWISDKLDSIHFDIKYTTSEDYELLEQIESAMNTCAKRIIQQKRLQTLNLRQTNLKKKILDFEKHKHDFKPIGREE